MSFTNLKQYDISAEKSVQYDLVDITMNDKIPFLMVRPATEANKPYSRAQLKSSNKRLQRAVAKGISIETLEANRDDDRVHYPQYVITGWGNVFDDAHNEVPFTPANCQEFLEALPNWIFDQVRNFCSSPVNFADTVNEDELGN